MMDYKENGIKNYKVNITLLIKLILSITLVFVMIFSWHKEVKATIYDYGFEVSSVSCKSGGTVEVNIYYNFHYTGSGNRNFTIEVTVTTDGGSSSDYMFGQAQTWTSGTFTISCPTGGDTVKVEAYATNVVTVGIDETVSISHSYSAATCTEPKRCSVCGATSGSALGHAWSWTNNSTNHWQYCTRSGCGATQNEAAHIDNNADGICDNTNCNYRMYTIISVPTAVTGLTYDGQTKTGVPNGTGYTITGNTGVNAGSYTATASLQSGYRWTGAQTGNKSISWSIGKGAASNPTLSNVSKQYDGSALYIGVTGGSGGTLYYSSRDGSSGSWSGWTTTKPSRTNYGTTYVKAYVVGDSNHNNTSETGSYTITINKREIAVSWGSTTTFTYNGSNQAPTASASSGVSGQTLNITRTTAIDAGTNITSTASITSVTGGDVNNYTLTGATKTYTINPKSVAISLGSTSFTYNGAAQGPTASASSGVTGETINITSSTAIDAGTHTSTVTFNSVSGGRANKNNYSLTGTSKQFTISPKSVAVSWGSTTTFTYNGAGQAPTASATSGVTGETINVTRTTAIDAGSHTSTASISSVSGGQAKSENYTLTGTTKSFTINPKSIATNWGTTTTFTYNGSGQAPTADATSGVTGETINVTRTTEIDAGTYTSEASISSVSGGQAKKENYTLTGTSKSYTINRKSITVTADNKTKTYGQANPAFTVTIGATGVAGETGNTSGSPTTTATALSNIGTYDITQGSVALADNLPFKASNYAMSFEKGTLTVNRAVPSLVLSNKHVVYNLAPQEIDPVVVTGVSGGTVPKGAITYTYYKDSSCTQQTTPANSGATANGAPPVNAGASDEEGKYYVKATIAEEGNYAGTTSNVAELFIERATMSGYVSIGGENSAGGTLTVDTRGISPKGTTNVYKFYANATKETTGGTILESGQERRYVVKDTDNGQYIYVVVTAVKNNYYTKDFYAIMMDSIDNNAPQIGELVALNAFGEKILGEETKLEIKDCYDASGIAGYEWQFSGDGNKWVTIANEESNESHSEISHQMPRAGIGSYRVLVRDIHGNVAQSNIVTVGLVYDRRPIVKLTPTQTDKDKVVIETIIKSVAPITKVTVNASEVLSNTFVVDKINSEYTTTFNYNAYINGIFIFEITDELGNITQEKINISTISEEGADITYEIKGATAVSNAQIVFKANELVKIANPNGYDGITFNTSDYATTITATIPQDIEFGESKTFIFQSTSYNETEVTVAGPIMTGVEYLGFINSDVLNMNVTLEMAYALAKSVSSAQIYINGNVYSYYGLTSNSLLRPTTTLAATNDLSVAQILGNASSTKYLSGNGETIELEKVSGIVPTSDDRYTNGNATGIRNIEEGTISNYVEGSSLSGDAKYSSFRVKLIP